MVLSRIFLCGFVVCIFALLGCGGDTSVAADPGEACEVDTDCDQGASCQTGTCDLSKGECSYAIQADYCFVDGACYIAGQVPDTDKCTVCTPTTSSTSMTAVQCQPGQQCTSSDGCIDDEKLCQGDDSNCVSDNPCYVGTCNDTGKCDFNPVEGGSCDDGDDCTADDVCDATGTCSGTYTCTCTTDEACPAATDACMKSVCTDDNTCVDVSVDDGAGCDDGDGCTVNDACNGGVCTGDPKTCPENSDDDSGDACNEPVCIEGACTTQPVNEGESCDDGDECTEKDTCGKDGTCTGNYTCPCSTNEDCPSTACQAGVCTNGACGFEAMEDGITCDDGDVCTSATICQAGVCEAGNPVTCPDTGNPCTFQVCDNAQGGCVEKNATDESTCNDGLYCTTNDHCDGKGQCVGGGATLCPGDDDQNECTTQECSEAEGGCVAVEKADGESCSPSNVCVASGQCTGGVCVDGAIAACMQTANPCTDTVCIPEGNQGCVEQNEPSGQLCGDLQSCTGYKLTKQDSCNGSGTCVSGSTSSCDGHLTCKSTGLACRTSCTTDDHCVSPWQCNGAGSCSCYEESYYHEYYFVGGETWGQLGCGKKRAQTFLAPGTTTMTDVYFRLKATNDNPCTGKSTTGQVTAGLYKTENGKPTGSALVTKTASVANLSSSGMTVKFADFNYKMQDGTTYAFVLSTNSTTHTVRWATKATNSQGQAYTDGKAYKKTDLIGPGLPGSAPDKTPETTPAFGWTEVTGKDHYFSIAYDIDCTGMVIDPFPGVPGKP